MVPFKGECDYSFQGVSLLVVYRYCTSGFIRAALGFRPAILCRLMKMADGVDSG